VGNQERSRSEAQPHEERKEKQTNIRIKSVANRTYQNYVPIIITNLYITTQLKTIQLGKQTARIQYNCSSSQSNKVTHKLFQINNQK
jgi:hypothetical protein